MKTTEQRERREAKKLNTFDRLRMISKTMRINDKYHRFFFDNELDVKLKSRAERQTEEKKVEKIEWIQNGEIKCVQIVKNWRKYDKKKPTLTYMSHKSHCIRVTLHTKPIRCRFISMLLVLFSGFVWVSFLHSSIWIAESGTRVSEGERERESACDRVEKLLWARIWQPALFMWHALAKPSLHFTANNKQTQCSSCWQTIYSCSMQHILQTFRSLYTIYLCDVMWTIVSVYLFLWIQFINSLNCIGLFESRALASWNIWIDCFERWWKNLRIFASFVVRQQRNIVNRFTKCNFYYFIPPNATVYRKEIKAFGKQCV